MSEAFWEHERQLDGFLVKTEYVRLAGDLPTGALLSQIVYWFRPGKNGKTKLQVLLKDGRAVLAKSRDGLAAECGLTLKQYTRAIRVLQDLELIEVHLHMFQQRVTPHIWLNEKRLRVLVGYDESSQLTVPKGINIGEPLGSTDCDLSAHSYISTETTTETTAETTQHAESTDMKAQEILDKMKGPKPIMGTGVKALELLWKQRVGLLTDQFVKPLTGMEIGQLKHVHKVLGDDTKKVLEWALDNWSLFAHRVSVEHGVSAPQSPVPGFFCKHYDVAVQSIAPAKVGKVLQKDQPTPTTKVQPVDNPVDNIDIAGVNEVQATLDALAAIQKPKE